MNFYQIVYQICKFIQDILSGKYIANERRVANERPNTKASACSTVTTTVHKMPAVNEMLVASVTKQCQLCFQIDEVIIMKCKHVMCESCIDIQQLYTKEPCFLCANKYWGKQKNRI